MPRLPVTLAAAAGLALLPAVAGAQEQSIARSPGDHPSYFFEAEPHAILGFAAPFYSGDGDGFGVGFRGTFHIANGFIPDINDSVAVGVGIDLGGYDRVYVPVVLQWNFWLSTHFSVFGEPGIAIGSGPSDEHIFLALFLGGRYHFTDRIALTLRLGYPDVSIGFSFFL